MMFGYIFTCDDIINQDISHRIPEVYEYLVKYHIKNEKRTENKVADWIYDLRWFGHALWLESEYGQSI